MQIHIDRNGTQFGPYNLDEVNHYLDVGHLLPTDLAWHEGSPAWIPLMTVPGIKPRATPPPPPPPRSPTPLATYSATARPPIKKSSLILLTLFLGGIGVHKFYTGNWGWGVLYVLFCWTFLTIPLALGELVRYIMMDDAVLQQRYQEVAGKAFGFI